MTLIEQLLQYQPYNEQEKADLQVMLDFLSRHDDAFLRTNLIAHVTASGWVINGDGKKVLMAYHKIYDSWAWTGGHADGEEDLLSVAVREAREETGLQTVTPVMEAPFSVEILTVKEDENAGVSWFDQAEALEKCSEPWMIDRVYRKLMEKCRKILCG